MASEARDPGVICSRLMGDSGRTAPGPTDWLNFRREGVAGARPFSFKAGPGGTGSVGVRGREPLPASRLMALDRGRKIPAPGRLVLK